MPRRAVYTEVMDVVERRIAEGDYMLKDLPGERKLAEEVGVSYMTARKAVSQLIEKGVLSRKSNGSLVVHQTAEPQAAGAQIVLLTPGYPSSHFVHCRLAISKAAEKRDLRFRPVEFLHWYDPVVREALDGSDGLLLIPSTEPIPPKILEALTDPAQRVVFFDGDMSRYGLPSVRLFSRAHITELFEHLWGLGHRRVNCLNAQGHNHEIERRITHWRDWLKVRGGTGELWDTPVRPYSDPVSQGYRTMARVLEEQADPKSLGAIVCTTQPAATGAIRACHDAQVQVGRDVSICAINNEPTGRFSLPSLTGLEMPDLDPLLAKCFTWFADPAADWPGELTLMPEHSTLFKGESTGPANS